MKKLYNQATRDVQSITSNVHTKNQLEKAKESLKSIGEKYFIPLNKLDLDIGNVKKNYDEELKNKKYPEAAKIAKELKVKIDKFKDLGKETQKSISNLKKDIKKVAAIEPTLRYIKDL